MVVAIDDLQWLDHASGRALRYALRRLDAEPVGVLATLRDGDDPLEVSATLPPGRTEVLAVGPLGSDALRRLLTPVVESISRPTLQRIHAVSGGNPLYALELARGLGAPATAAPRRPAAAAVAAGGDRRAARRPCRPSSPTLLRPCPRSATRRCASCAPPCPAPTSRGCSTAAERCGLLVVEEDLRVRFAHPLVGSVVYGTMGPLVRRALHARLAAAAGDPDVRARHLALSTDEPDAAVAALLEDAADRARAREAFDLAADFAGHSAPADPARGRRRRAAARACAEIDDRAVAGEASRALALADRLVATLPPGPARCEALLERAYLGRRRHRGSAELLRPRALDDAGDDERLRGRVLDLLGWLHGMFAGDIRGRRWTARARPSRSPSGAATGSCRCRRPRAPRPPVDARRHAAAAT